MKKAAAAQEYERAAELRDMLADLQTHDAARPNKFERMPYSLPLAIDPQKDLAELGEALGLARRRRSASKASTFPTSAARSPWRRW